MISPENSDRNNASESPHMGSKSNNKGQLKRIEQQVTVARNRLTTLKQQLQKQKDAIKKNKVLTQEVLAKKVAVNSINSYKLKDNSQDIARVQSLKKRNLSMRLEHEKSLENIQKAIYLVKLDDAREVKNISEEHRRKIRELENDETSKRAQKRKHLRDEAEKAKEKYMKYWKQKLSSIYAEQALSAQEVQKNKEEKQRQLKALEEEEIKLLEEINLLHSKNIQTKKEYVAALSLPVKEVAMAMANSNGSNDQKETMKKSLDYSRSKSLAEMEGNSPNKTRVMHGGEESSSLVSLPSIGPKIKVPHTMNVNETKLKIILQQLKKIQKKKRYEEVDATLTNRSQN